MSARKQYPLRIDPVVWEALQKWAADDMRSANGQVEYLLTKALREAGRLGGGGDERTGPDEGDRATGRHGSS